MSIEFLRELPCVLILFIETGFFSLSDIRLAMLSLLLNIIGIIILGFFTSSFPFMLIFIFISSIGMHLFIPLQDSIGISLVKEGSLGADMGRYKSVVTIFSMFENLFVFIGFKAGFFSFASKIKWVFIYAALLFFIAFILLFTLEKSIPKSLKSDRKLKFDFKKEYRYYYTLVVLYDVQKQMMIVYGPWVLIELIGKKADTLAVLGMIGSFIGVFFIPKVGKCLDVMALKLCSMLMLYLLSAFTWYMDFYALAFILANLSYLAYLYFLLMSYLLLIKCPIKWGSYKLFIFVQSLLTHQT